MVGVFKGPRYKQQDYIDVLSLLYELLNKARREGFMAWKTMSSGRPRAPCSPTTPRCRPTTT